jgi:aspartyl-tRNA(Asn)/glutamyl-tRNA(Gln) amidotransferase subunit B
MSPSARSKYEVVIGLEVHTHLRTDSKLFSPAPVSYGEPPNHSVHPIDLGLPGVLPVLNERVVELAIRLGLATNSTVNPRSVFARKNYFYPDLSKGYQISQFEDPVVSHGWIDIELPPEAKGQPPRTKRIGITRAHLEEDAGKSIHDAAVTGGSDTHVDFNRAGIPLLEIVSEPDMRSSQEAGAYLRALRSLLRYIGVSDADMEKGQFRCDANVSLRPIGQQEFGTRTELKNINSFRFVEAGIEAEIDRQAQVLESGGEVVQATMAYDEVSDRTSLLRTKENADDYRYFPDPDLIPLLISEEQIERVRSAMPELPAQRCARFEKELGLGKEEASALSASRSLADLFEQTLEASKDAKATANWLLQSVLPALRQAECEIEESRLSAQSLAALMGLVKASRLTAKSARELLPQLIESGGDPEALMQAQGLEAVSDQGLIETAASEVLAANPEAVEKYRGGDAKPLNFLMGQVMKRTSGRADPDTVREILANMLRA